MPPAESIDMSPSSSAATHFGDIDSAGDIAVAELGIDNFPGRTLAELCPSIIPGQCGERQPIKGEGSRVCNDWGAWEPGGVNGDEPDRWTTLAGGDHGDQSSYSALDSSWVMRDHTDWFYELHNDGMGQSFPFTPWYPYCPAHSAPGQPCDDDAQCDGVCDGGQICTGDDMDCMNAGWRDNEENWISNAIQCRIDARAQGGKISDDGACMACRESACTLKRTCCANAVPMPVAACPHLPH